MVNVPNLFSQSILIETIVQRTLLYNFIQKIETSRREVISSPDLFDYNRDIGNITIFFRYLGMSRIGSRYSKQRLMKQRKTAAEDG